jgi:hypothetical protein
MSELSLRVAVVGDAADIHEILLARAAELSLTVETLEQEEALYAAVRRTLAFGESWVAERGGRIAAAVVVDNIQTGRHWGEHEHLDMRHATAAPACGAEVLDALIGKVLERRALITARVRDADRTGLAARLDRLGFQRAEQRTGETHFRREP